MSCSPAVLAATIALASSATAIAAPVRAEPRQANLASQAEAPNIFGTIALPLKSTRFDHRWRRVMRSGAASSQLASLLRAGRGAPRVEQLRLVNASLNARIRYRFDANPSGDYWSTANETLSQSAGDCEDYVIAKLQVLKALGVPEQDLFMTIGHDGFAGAVHAILVARARGQYFVLDNRTNRLIPHREYRGFYPMITLGSRSSWIHGYERGKTPAAVKAMSIAYQSNRELRLGSSSGSASAPALRL